MSSFDWEDDLAEMFAQASGVSGVSCDLGVAWLVTRLLEGLPPDERAHLLRSKTHARIPLRRVSPAALEQFAAGLRLLEAYSHVPTRVIALNRCPDLVALLREHGYLVTWDSGWEVSIGDPDANKSPTLLLGVASLKGEVERRAPNAPPSAQE